MRLALVLLLAACGAPAEPVGTPNGVGLTEPGQFVTPAFAGAGVTAPAFGPRVEGASCNTFIDWSWCHPSGLRARCQCDRTDPRPLEECAATWRLQVDEPRCS